MRRTDQHRAPRGAGGRRARPGTAWPAGTAPWVPAAWLCLLALAGAAALCLGACGTAANAPQVPAEKVAVSANPLSGSVTVTATKVGNIEKAINGFCGTSYQNNGGNVEVGGEGGGCFGTNVFRDYFIFNLSGIQHASASAPSAATFSTTGGGTSGSTNTITFRKYNGDPSSSVNSTTFNNLSSGTSYGTSAGNANPVSVALNATALGDIQSALGTGSFTIAGSYGSESSSVYSLNLSPALSNVTLALTLTCDSGYADCNGGSDGCEALLTSDTNCGGCGITCGGGQTCSAGSCVACGAGLLDCDGNGANGCETDTTSVTSCGTTCANVVSCDDSNACTVDSCSAGSCSSAPGNAGAVCRTRTGECDAAEVCDGVSASCPTDGYAAKGTDCAYPTSATTIWSGGGITNSLDFNSGAGDWTSQDASLATASTVPGGWGSDAAKFVTTSSSSGVGRYTYWKLTTTGYTPVQGDYLEYDVYLEDNADGIGGLDVSDSMGYWRDLAMLDQNGLGFHPATDISSKAYHTWYHRRFAVPRTGSAINKWDVVTERDAASATSTAYIDNLMITKKAGACDGANVCKLKDASGCSTDSDCASNLCQAGSLDSSLVHRWDFSGSSGSTTATDSTGSSNGTVTNASLNGSGAVSLSGGTSNQFVDLPNGLISGLTNVTVEVWLSWSGGSAWQRIFDFGTSDKSEGTQGTGISYLFATPSNGSGVRTEYLRSGGSKVGVTSSSALATGSVVQVVSVFDDSNNAISLYINGALIGSATLNTNDHLSSISDVNDWIGKSQFSTDPELGGTIYDVRIYDKALSGAEVYAAYQTGSDNLVCVTPLGNGLSCTTNQQCVSGFCVDGVCCNNACAGGTGDCQACSTTAGAPTDGTCAPVSSSHTCRASTGTCDVAESCDGSSTTCPADLQ